MSCSVEIGPLKGPFVGCIKDFVPLALNAPVMPDPTGFTFSWSKVSGTGGGVFLPSAAVQSPEFKGITSGNLTIKVIATNGVDTCWATTDLTVLPIDDLTESVPLQEMPEADVLANFYTIPFSDPSDGDLQAVLISPIADPDDPYRWIDASNVGGFGAKVDHGNGDVMVELRRTGVYLVKTIRQNGSKFRELSFMGAEPGRGKKLEKGKTSKTTKPSADLILIGTFVGDRFLQNARDSIGA